VKLLVVVVLLCGLALPALAQLKSGPDVGKYVLPFTSNIVTGPYRGKQHCFVCEAKVNQYAVVGFARGTQGGTARLLQQFKQQYRQDTKRKLLSWFVFLGPRDTVSQLSLERRVDSFARANALTQLNLSALGDPQGPPGYRIAPDAEFTVVVFRNGKVLLNRAFKAGEWNEKTAETAMKDINATIR
jgi:hypothetical protein